MNIHPSIFHSIDHLFTGGNCVITKLFLCYG
jgi:hypothetical protein